MHRQIREGRLKIEHGGIPKIHLLASFSDCARLSMFAQVLHLSLSAFMCSEDVRVLLHFQTSAFSIIYSHVEVTHENVPAQAYL